MATGTVTCDLPEVLIVSVSGWQVAGRDHLPLYGSQLVVCDGTTRFDIPITSMRGEVRSYDATLTVSAFPFREWDEEPEEPTIPSYRSGSENWEFSSCTGEEQQFALQLPASFDDEVAVDVNGYTSDGGDWDEEDYFSNGRLVEVLTK